VLGLLDTTLRALARRAARRPREQIIHASMPLYIRVETGRVVMIEVAPQSLAWWTTAHALLALDDPRDATECRLMLHGESLHPRRSLAASGVHHGDTLDLVAANAIPRRRRFRTPTHPRPR